MAQLSSYPTVATITGTDLIPLSRSGAVKNIAAGNLVLSSFYTTVGPVGSGADYIVDGTSDEVDINAAITAVNNAGGGTVVLEATQYSLSGTITLYSNINIAMEAGAVLTQTSTTSQVFQATGTSGTPLTNITVSGGKLVCPITGSGTTGFAYTYVNNSYIKNVEIYGSTLACISFTNCSYNVIDGCKLHDGVLHGMRIRASTFNHIVNCDVYNISLPIATGIGQGIYLYDGSTNNNVVDGCRVQSIGQSGVRIEGSYNIVSNCEIATVGRSAIKEEITGSTNPVGGICRNVLSGNVITDTNGQNGGHTGLWLQGYASKAEGNTLYPSGSFEKSADAITVNGRRCVVSNNNITGYNVGIEAEHPEVVITGNNITFCYTRGIWLSAITSGTNYSSVHEHSSITGNVVMNNSLTTIGGEPGIYVSASGSGNIARYNIISSNNASDNQTKCTATITSPASSGGTTITVSKTSEYVAGSAQLVTPSWGFVAGMNITITDGVNSEVNVIASVDSETQLSVVNNLAHTYNAGSVTGKASQSYGVSFAALTSGSVTSNIVTNNICHGNVTGGVNLSADSSVVNANNITT